MIQKMINSIKYSIRKLAIKFYDKTEYYVVPKDLFSRISLNHNNPEELNKIREEIKTLQKLYPEERSLLKADSVVERMRIIGK